MPSLDSQPPKKAPGKWLNASLWGAQFLLFLTFAGGAVWKVATPLAAIAAKMPWVAEVPKPFFYTTAALDFLGGLGLVLPLTGVRPELSRWAALACGALMVAASIFHLARGEAAQTPFNFLLLALCGFVFWGRRN